MKELQELLVGREVAFDHLKNRVMCFPHIVNICTCHIVAASTKVGKKYIESNGLDGDEGDEFDSADDPIRRVANFVRYIRSSHSRKDAFARLVKLCIDDDPDLNKKHPEIQERKDGQTLELRLHVKTRWDSVYLMIRRFRFLKKVSTRVRTSNELSTLTLGIQAVDMYFVNDPSIEHMRLSAAEWDELENIQGTLQVCSQIPFARHVDGQPSNP